MTLRLPDLNFDLPPELIAQEPTQPRDQARMLVYRRATGEISHARVCDIGKYLPAGSVIVANNSKVRKARLFARLANGRPVEILLLEEISEGLYRALLGGKKIKNGDILEWYTDATRTHSLDISWEVRARDEDSAMSTYQIKVSKTEKLDELIEQYGAMPLPPYIHKHLDDEDRYQTVFAEQVGSAAAPTAGLHFTPQLIEALQKQDVRWKEVTLHVGLGTFLPLRNEVVSDNRLHEEQTWITPEVAETLSNARANNQLVLAVGTTSVRTIESHSTTGKVLPGHLGTSLFIYPGFRFQTVNALLTNFHLPHSSLLLLVAAFLADDHLNPLSEQQSIKALHHIYAEAIKEKYKFFSFGDCMLIL